ncbi:MAG: FecR domain-containing protein [Salinivirgaceae bacterium]|jgi:ferric-dicitrate binding protein FerR (iron transport regulator)
MEEIFDIATNKITGLSLSQAEELALDNWLRIAENQEMYEELQKVWQLTGKLSFDLNPDVDAEWESFKNLIPDKKIKQLNKKLIYSFTSIAASIILLLGIWGVSQLFADKEIHYFSGNHIQYIQLQDNTKVYLNKNSQLTVSKEYNINNRNVTLTGEALFEVAENESVPFIVNIFGGVQAKVLGTQFNLKAFDSNKEFSLNVFSGKVLFGNPITEEPTLVIKGQQANYDVLKNKVTDITEFNPNAVSWKTKNLQFDNTPITEVASLLGELIGKQVIIPENSNQIRYSGSFDDPTTQQAAEVLGLAMGWEYKITHNSVVFSIKKENTTNLK